MRRYEFSESASIDLAEIQAHIYNQDPSTATAVLKRIRESIEAVSTFPEIGKETARPGVYSFGGTPKQPFRFTYRFTEEMVTVIRIFRSTRAQTHF